VADDASPAARCLPCTRVLDGPGVAGVVSPIGGTVPDMSRIKGQCRCPGTTLGATPVKRSWLPNSSGSASLVFVRGASTVAAVFCESQLPRIKTGAQRSSTRGRRGAPRPCTGGEAACSAAKGPVLLASNRSGSHIASSVVI
jgi:hypothetical protein